ncbi:MAG: hypothetical protein ACP5T5_05820 [Thermoprotei archaeon]
MNEGNAGALRVRPLFTFVFSPPKGFDHRKAESEPAGQVDQQRINELNNAELHVLGEAFVRSNRLTRKPLSSFSMGSSGKAEATSAEAYLVTHKGGAELIEVWVELPEQEFNSQKFLDLLKPDSEISIVKEIYRFLPYLGEESPLFTLIGISGQNADVDDFIENHKSELVKLLYLDPSPVPFKRSFVEGEINRNFCIREGGASFMSNSAALSIMFMSANRSANFNYADLQSKCTLPFFIVLEILLLEKEILRKYYERLVRGSLSINGLIGLKQEILDGLEEYYGIIEKATQFSAPLMDFGENALGINDLYDSVIDRLDAVTFDITTNYARNSNVLSFWLTVLFGSLDTGLLVESVASIVYTHNLFGVAAWTALSTALTFLMIFLLLYRRIR